jgi:hypothetical protein
MMESSSIACAFVTMLIRTTLLRSLSVPNDCVEHETKHHYTNHDSDKENLIEQRPFRIDFGRLGKCRWGG